MLGEGRVPYAPCNDRSVNNDVLCTSTQPMSPDVSGWYPEDTGPEPRAPFDSHTAYGERADVEA